MLVDLKKTYESRGGLPRIEKIDSLIFSIAFPQGSCGPACRDVCCSGGATMDIVAFERLLKHRNEPAFEGVVFDGYRFEKDSYSPGGLGCYTRFEGNRCTFQNRSWGCSIHSFCLANRIDVRELKFFTCCLFPVEVNKIGDVRNVLTAGYEMRHAEYDLPCKKNGGAPVFDVAKGDLEYFYGGALVAEIEEIRRSLRCEGSSL
ncbi:MAG: hypothetical protein MUC63_08570 [Planctomycetes bacterium]|jgi:hypothetical protein|nr:hypothetical protein [Planctomycetota bacterium]